MAILVLTLCFFIIIINMIWNKKYKELECEVLRKLEIPSWDIVPYYDINIVVKSRSTLEKYDDVKFFKENKDRFIIVENIIKRKKQITGLLISFLTQNEYKSNLQYNRLLNQINKVLKNAEAYRILVSYISSAGNNLGQKEIAITQQRMDKFRNDPSILMNKGEYSKFLKEKEKEALKQKQHDFYERINKLIDYANARRDSLIIKGSQEQIDKLIDKLFERTINNINKIKAVDSEGWDVVGDFILHIKKEIESIVDKNDRILRYYESSDFNRIKETCEVLMSSQREFNEYIAEKVQTVSKLFGTRVVRNETINDDSYEYIRPYKKTVSPFTAEVSATVFASAENNPLEYVVKYFYPNKRQYPEQIQKLQLLIEELETLKEARQIIENYKADYQQYLKDVPDYVMKDDEDGFYIKLGFTDISEDVLNVEYKFSYTSGGGLARRTFSVPMTEDTIAELINILESKLTANAFTKEQRSLMTKKLRMFIKERDNYTCCQCGNSLKKEPNLLLEIDHIIPVSKGGLTLESNLQTLCWKCNRSKSSKIL